jgi:retinol dehydrogenase 12
MTNAAIKKTILITGATNGIGLCAARALADMGHSVILHGRDPLKGEATLTGIRSHNPQADVRFIPADFSSLTQVRALAEKINQLPKLDILINNAGAMFFTRQETCDGFEATFAVNHLAPFLLTNLVLETLKNAGTARIINVASNAHRRAGPLDFTDLMSQKNYSPFKVYCRSKLANMLFTHTLAQRLARTGVITYSLHPGVVRTGFGHNSNLFMRLLLNIAGKFFMISPEEGAKTLVYLASSEAVTKYSGDYFVDCTPRQPAALAKDTAAADRLWLESARLAALA